MIIKQTVDLSGPSPSSTQNYNLAQSQGCSYSGQYKCWTADVVGAFFKFRLSLQQAQDVELIFQLCSSLVGDKTDCPISITVNGSVVTSDFDPHIVNFYNMSLTISGSMLRAGDNDVVVRLSGGHTKVFLRSAGVVITQSMDFSIPAPTPTANYSLAQSQGCSFSSQYKCWTADVVGAFFKFKLTLDQPQDIQLLFQLCSSLVEGKTDCPVTLTVNGIVLVNNFDPHIVNFYGIGWTANAGILKAGANDVLLRLAGGHTKVFLRSAGIGIPV